MCSPWAGLQRSLHSQAHPGHCMPPRVPPLSHTAMVLPVLTLTLQEAKERLLRESSLASDQREAPSDGSQAAARRFPPPAPLDILEGQWNRLHAATGALHPDGVIAFWQGEGWTLEC